MNEVALTAASVFSPIGSNLDDFAQNMFAGKSGTVDIRNWLVPADFPVQAAAPIEKSVRDHLLGEKPADRSLYGHVAIELLERLEPGFDPKLRYDALLFGARHYNVPNELAVEFARTGRRPREEITRPEEAALALEHELESRGTSAIPPSQILFSSNGCVTSAETIGTAFRRIRAGQWQRALVLAIELIEFPGLLLNFFQIGALADTSLPAALASKPYSAGRTGFVKGEAAVLLQLENLAAAQARGAKVLAKISGYAATSDAFSLADGREDGQAAAEAMRLAIRNAGLRPEQIDYVNGHGTSTQKGDIAECRALQQVFTTRVPPVSSLKSQVGHATPACSALEALACAMMLREQKIAPTINYTGVDPACSLDFVPNQARAAKLEHVLSNSFGLGGLNACLVLSRA